MRTRDDVTCESSRLIARYLGLNMACDSEDLVHPRIVHAAAFALPHVFTYGRARDGQCH
jgi:hypothetical protein